MIRRKRLEKSETECQHESVVIKPRKPGLAAVLCLIGAPVGHVYAGNLCRGLFLWCLGSLVIEPLLLSCIATLPLGAHFCLLPLILFLFYRIFMMVDAYLVAKHNQHAPLRSYQKKWIYLVVLNATYFANFGLGICCKTFVAEAFLIPSDSMAPTLQAGDRIQVDKLWYNPARMKRDDLAVYRSKGPGSPSYIMRVVGLPGDLIEIKEEEVFVNGVRRADKHASFNGPIFIPKIANYGPLAVPFDSFFVLGDNRRNANDSRFNGPIPLSDLIGRANMIYWSRERHYPDPRDKSRYETGLIAWERIGTFF